MADTPEMRELIAQEFPGYDPAAIAGPSRRRFLKLMAASMAMAGLTLTGCRRWPQEKLAPYSTNPQGRIPGIPEQYATSWEVNGVGQGLLVTSFDGRPIKIEGNPSHPSAWTIKDKHGATDAFAQASVLEMYDPQRSQSVVDRTVGTGKQEKRSDWTSFSAAIEKEFAGLKGNSAAFAILSEASASPSVQAMKKRLLAAYPQAKWYEYEPLSWDAELEGSRLAFGKSLRTKLHLDKANVVVSLDADLLGTHPAHVRYAADWSEKRRSGDKGEMNRVYMAESSFTITGSVADERIAVDPSRVYAIARAIAGNLGVAGVTGFAILNEKEREFANKVAAELKAAPGNGVVAVGPSAPAIIHALGHAINQQIGAFGKTLTLIEDPAGDRPTHFAAITQLCKDMASDKVKALFIIGGNPAYDAPTDVDFPGALARVPLSIHLALYDDETSRLCKWHLPRAHYLESWGDARSWDGTTGLTQPLIEPLFGGKSTIELLAMLAGDSVTAGDEIVRRTWKEQFIKGGDFELGFKKALEAGVLPNSASPAVTAQVNIKDFPGEPASAGGPGTVFLKFEPDAHTYDGRYANNGWLQETHEPLTKLVWDNAALISVKDARAWGDLKTGDVVKLEGNNRFLEAAVYVMPGQPVGVISLSVGYGRTASGDIGNRLGFNAYIMRASTTPYVLSGIKVTPTGQTYTLALTTLHHFIDKVGMDGREERVGGKGESGLIVREATLAEYKESKNAPHKEFEKPSRLQLFDPLSDKYNGPHAWGMTVDLNTCIGCNACVVACQAENNVGVVGKDQVLMHREMGWIRIDRYFKGNAEDPEIDVIHQPMMCQHCENAPCEQVCPVAATMHDTEGLNVMVYNRCIGTRYCSNNCPYKVRRFNYFDWHAKPPRKSTGVMYLGIPDVQQLEQVDKIRQMQFNPEVTVRMRGVMEKCTYCIQRISKGKIAKRIIGEDVKDGDIITACQQACPTQAIVFGNLREQTSKVAALQKNARAYECLGELNPQPRTRYLAKLRNPAEGASRAPAHSTEEHTAASHTESVG
jgi:MoCo/4Fe-4S cofactor protein with predicted Tat translocation signal